MAIPRYATRRRRSPQIPRDRPVPLIHHPPILPTITIPPFPKNHPHRPHRPIGGQRRFYHEKH